MQLMPLCVKFAASSSLVRPPSPSFSLLLLSHLSFPKTRDFQYIPPANFRVFVKKETKKISFPDLSKILFPKGEKICILLPSSWRCCFVLSSSFESGFVVEAQDQPNSVLPVVKALEMIR
ncbi:hypothetical protein Bca101_086518 [Brassica carinata]